MAATAAGSNTLVGDAGAAGGATATTTTFEAQRSVVHRVPPPPLQDEGRRVISRGRAEASGHEERGAEARDWAGGGDGSRCASSRRGERELKRTVRASRAEVRWHA